MESYVITYSDYGKNSLTDAYETIQGKNPVDALKKRFDKNFKRVNGEQGRYSNVIVVKGHYDEKKNNIVYRGKYIRLCYIEIKGG
jgi:hypothetical protein